MAVVSRYREETDLAFGIIYTDTKKKKKNKKKNKESKDQAASEQKLEDLSALELFVASSDLDLSQTSDLNVSKLIV